MRKILCSSLAVVLALAPTVARAQTEEETRKKIMEDLKPWIEQEVQRRVKEAMEAAKPSLRDATMSSSEQTNAPTVGAAPVPGAAPAAGTAAPAWTPAQPITVARAGSAYMNISFSLLTDFGWSTTPDVRMIEVGDHDPAQRGFTIPNAEIAFDGAVDPYFKGFANVVLKLDEEAETTIELEEAFLLTTSLPGNLQAKAGQFFTEFGRQNPQHPHAWAFVDQPLILNRLFGPEGLRNPGARLSWLAATPFYTEVMLTIQNGNGGTAFSFRNPEDTFGRTAVERGLRGPGDLLYVPRVASSFDLSDTQTLLLGASAAFGPNDSGVHTRTQIYGADVYWKWRPVNAQRGFPFVSWQTEALYREYEADADPTAPLPAETFGDWGFYSQALWGFRLGWVAGLRGEFVTGDKGANDANDQLARGDRTRLSPNLTWYPTEFSKLRLQYNYDHGQAFGDEHSVWMQFEFLLGAHAAHKF